MTNHYSTNNFFGKFHVNGRGEPGGFPGAKMMRKAMRGQIGLNKPR